MMRSQMVGTLRATDVGEEVALCGWVAARRDHGGVVFLDLRDASGLVQIVADPSTVGEAVHRVGREWVLRVEGDVRARPEGTVNAELPTGAVEVSAATLEVLNEAESPPFPLAERADDVDEVLRLRHRYLDLRRPQMQRNLRLRATVNAALRTSMAEQGFVEIETPMLIASTPEGARDFVVPSRLQPGAFYALPQSPQLFKQLLMVGGIDRYFQIARCLRDEDLRADRQFEFMQYDAEMSFADQEDVMAVVTEAVGAAIEAVDRIASRRRPAHDLARGDGAVRDGQARHPLRHGARRSRRGVRRHRVPRVPGRGGQGHLRAAAWVTSAARRSTTWSTGPSCSARPGSCGCGSRRVASSTHPS